MFINITSVYEIYAITYYETWIKYSEIKHLYKKKLLKNNNNYIDVLLDRPTFIFKKMLECLFFNES